MTLYDSKSGAKTYVWVLIDGTGDEGRDVVPITENLREGVRERWSSLNSGKVEHPDVVPVLSAFS